MRILAIETATDACSAALLINDEILVEYQLAPRQHTQLILPMIERLMAKSQLSVQNMDAVAFGKGPGAFTGLRIAAGVTQGLALSADLPVIPVSTLAAIAQQSYQRYQASHMMVALDARINEVYWGLYKVIEGRVVLCGNEQVILPENIDPLTWATADSWIGVGSGWEAYSEILRAKAKQQLAQIYPEDTPSAEFVAQLAAFEYQQGHLLSVEQAQPVYLRDKVADTIAERQALKQ